MTPADITAAISQLTRLLEQQRRLWTVEDIAEYMQLSVDHVRERVVHKPGFPAAIRNPRIVRSAQDCRITVPSIVSVY